MRRHWAAGAAIVTCLAFCGSPVAGQGAAAPDETVFTCPAGTDPDAPGPLDQARPPASSFTRPVVFDPGSGQIVVFPGGTGDVNETAWTFDVCTNTWSRIEHDPRAARPSAPQALAYDTSTGVIVGLDGENEVWTYAPDAPGWEWRGAAPADATGTARLLWEAAPQRLLFARVPLRRSPERGRIRLWTYDASTAAWGEVATSGEIPVPGHGEYLLLASDPVTGALVAYEGDTGRTWRLDPVTSVWSSGQRGPALRRIGWEATGGEIANDDAAGLIVVYGDDRVIGYDATADTWQTLYDEPGHPYSIGPLARIGHWMVYDPVNERLVVMGGQAYVDGEWTDTDGEDDGWVLLDDVWAFDARQREWTELLAPSEPPLAVGGGATWGRDPDEPVE